jgi:hypothetical protein
MAEPIISDLVTNQIMGCVKLVDAVQAAQPKRRCYLLYDPGDAPTVTVQGESFDICHDGQLAYDVWDSRSGQLGIIRTGLTFDQAVAILTGGADGDQITMTLAKKPQAR